VAECELQYGGRLLGSNGVPSNPNFTNTRIYAIANGQPSLVPVLQIHSPEGPPSAGSSLNQGEQKFRIDGYKRPEQHPLMLFLYRVTA